MTNQHIAQVCHEANRAYCEAIGDFTQKAWGKAEQWQRDSAIRGVEFAISNPTAPASAQVKDSLFKAVVAALSRPI